LTIDDDRSGLRGRRWLLHNYRRLLGRVVIQVVLSILIHYEENRNRRKHHYSYKQWRPGPHSTRRFSPDIEPILTDLLRVWQSAFQRRRVCFLSVGLPLHFSFTQIAKNEFRILECAQ
jgi:hypothetical protein